ncbi:ArsR/SmtB family transcription factor [Halovivax gelatinilyticus]|uniref:ArsR/SmtB family transcription factor n=1 Tax=Halovivax gelatinilyticus TaxID=2961597 RepID=UPI0020CA3EA5|nr:helix-turn-helix transcriptional regulator [Halovivax gelatinilyticus]
MTQRSREETIADLFPVVAHPTRRSVLRTLRRTDHPTVETLARDLTERRAGEVDEDLSVALHHQHLPYLADVGVIDYDPDAGTIASTDATDAAYDLLDAVSN